MHEDKLEEHLNKLMAWLGGRWKAVASVAALLVITAVAIWLVVEYFQERELKAQLRFYEIEKISDEKEKIDALTAFSTDERVEKVALLADMELGSYYSGKGVDDKAIEYFNSALKKAEGSVRVMVIDGLAPLLIDNNKPDEAAVLYIESSRLKENPDPFMTKLSAGKAYEISGNVGEAVKIYNELTSGKDTPPGVLSLAEERLLWLETVKKSQ